MIPPTPDSRREPYILLGNGNTIQQILLDGSDGIPLLNDTDYDIIGVDYDIRCVSLCYSLKCSIFQVKAKFMCQGLSYAVWVKANFLCVFRSNHMAS